MRGALRQYSASSATSHSVYGQRSPASTMTPASGDVRRHRAAVLETEVGENLDLHRSELQASISLPSIRAMTSRPYLQSKLNLSLSKSLRINQLRGTKRASGTTSGG